MKVRHKLFCRTD